jgi:hypothetical protein
MRIIRDTKPPLAAPDFAVVDAVGWLVVLVEVEVEFVNSKITIPLAAIGTINLFVFGSTATD